jgi:hypothetical protein
MRIVGDAITVSLDGRALGTVRDSSLSEPGAGTVYANAAGYFRDIVYVPLDSEPSSATPAAPLPHGAFRIFDSPKKLSFGRKGVTWKDNAMSLDDATVSTKDVRDLPASKVQNRDAIIRAAIQMNPNAGSPVFGLRDVTIGGDHVSYHANLQFDSGVIKLFRQAGGRGVMLGTWSLPRVYGAQEWVPLELRAVGNTITAFFDGTELGAVNDTDLREAGVASIHAPTECHFRDIIYIALDAPASDPREAPKIP